MSPRPLWSDASARETTKAHERLGEEPCSHCTAQLAFSHAQGQGRPPWWARWGRGADGGSTRSFQGVGLGRTTSGPGPAPLHSSLSMSVSESPPASQPKQSGDLDVAVNSVTDFYATLSNRTDTDAVQSPGLAPRCPDSRRRLWCRLHYFQFAG